MICLCLLLQQNQANLSSFDLSLAIVQETTASMIRQTLIYLKDFVKKKDFINLLYAIYDVSRNKPLFYVFAMSDLI